MPISVGDQVYIFLCSIVGGMLIAFIYDAFRIKRKAIRTRSIIIHLEDFVYWIIVAAIMFAVVYYSNEGEIRGYIFIGAIIGVILYALLFSKIVIRSSMFIIGVIKKLLKAVWTVVTYPFRILFKILAVPARFLSKLFGKALNKARRAGRTRIAKGTIWRRMFKNIRKKI